jgi:hypothetical protein
MSSGSSFATAIPIVGVSTRVALDTAEANELNTLYGSGNWTITGRTQILNNGLYYERVDVCIKTGGNAQVYFNITSVVVANPEIWDDNDQRPGN